ncbi:MAG: hypothetical protein NTW68_12950 [candidate division NC10 bacterium]|nr:hypothetical protein [candidate division NC10 bacterium]
MYLFLWIGTPILLLDWFRSRRQEAIQRQIALTDAIDAQVGAIVSPVVTKPLWGPWRVRIAMPLTPPLPVGRILAIAHEVFSDIDRVNPGHYQIVLTPKERRPREGRMGRCALHVQR